MCGIGGVFNLDGRPVPADLMQAMSAALSHRGPDGEGQRIDGELGSPTVGSRS